MELTKALITSLIAHPFLVVAMLMANFPGEEAVLHVGSTIVPPDTPNVFRVCPEKALEEDLTWAVDEWNRALKHYDVPVRMEVVDHDCIIRVKPSDKPLAGEFGGAVEISPKEGVNTSEPIRFSMFKEILVTVWVADDPSLRRAIILHELGHALLLGHILDYKGPGPRPVMAVELDVNNPTTYVTEMDAYLAWLTHSFCRQKACGLMYVKMPNPVAASAIASAASATLAVVLTTVGGRVYVGGGERSTAHR
jgi:hypothetical protein